MTKGFEWKVSSYSCVYVSRHKLSLRTASVITDKQFLQSLNATTDHTADRPLAWPVFIFESTFVGGGLLKLSVTYFIVKRTFSFSPTENTAQAGKIKQRTLIKAGTKTSHSPPFCV